MRFLDLFAGIGGFRLGMEMAGHKCVGYVEWDKFARQSYEAIHDTKGEWTAHDITSVADEEWRELRGTVDIICGGFPCQAFSIAGERRGFQDTRGTMFFEIARAAEQIKPRFLLLENVKGLLSHDRGGTFATILSTLDELGYDAEWQVLNSKDFGVPQNRERVFIVGHLRGQHTRKIFPIRRSTEKTLKQVVGGQQGMRVYDPSGTACTLSAEGGGWGAKTGLYFINRPVFNKYTLSTQCQTLKARDYKDPCLVFQKTHGCTTTLKVNETGTLQAARLDKIPCIADLGKCGVHNYRIRKLTPRECWRLQGFPDWAFDKAKNAGISDSKLYKQAGNAVTVNVVYEIAKRLSK